MIYLIFIKRLLKLIPAFFFSVIIVFWDSFKQWRYYKTNACIIRDERSYGSRSNSMLIEIASLTIILAC